MCRRYWTQLNLETDSDEAAQGWCKDATNHMTDLRATIDGAPLHGLQGFRFASRGMFLTQMDDADPVYAYEQRPGYPPHTYPTYTDGFWLMLEPLSPGEHTISWGGKYVWQSTYPYVDVVEQEITYHVTVE